MNLKPYLQEAMPQLKFEASERLEQHMEDFSRELTEFGLACVSARHPVDGADLSNRYNQLLQLYVDSLYLVYREMA